MTFLADPYGEGLNTDSGGSAYLTHGRWVVYVRGELQTAPEIPAYSLSTREVVQVADHYPFLPPGTAQPARNNFTLLDAYAGVMLADWQITFGKQSLWWGPGAGGPMMVRGNNTALINMFRVNRTTPRGNCRVFLVGWGRFVAGIFFWGNLQGYDFVFSPTGFVGNFNSPVNPQPFIHGENLAFKPTKNFEFGFFRTTVYGGPGYPLTVHTLLRSLFSTTNESITAAGGAV